MKQSKFNSWIADEILWWRCDSTALPHRMECSPALQRLYEQPIEKLSDLTGSSQSPVIGIKVNEILEKPEKDLRFVDDYQTKEGTFTFQHRLSVYEEEGHKWVFAQCIDVTEMVKFEREIVDAKGRASVQQMYERQAMLEEQKRLIEESYQKQSRFLALLSHELRSPLLGVKSMVVHLKQHFADNDYLVERLRTINLTTEQMTFLVNDILTYSQTEYDSIVLHPKRFSLKQVFDYVKQLTKSIAADKGVFVSFVYVGDKDWVYGDSVRLAQVLINLIVNAIKFTPLGGVTVEVKQRADDLFTFQVTDSGEGIHPDKLEKIFDPFVQIKTEGSTNILGSGLGLAVVRQLVDIMGGHISVSSKFGVGTTFNFQVRLHPASKEIEVEELALNIEDEQVELLKQQHYRVLVVDDSKINRMVLNGFLRELGCQVEDAADGQQAWALFEQQDFDFVFLDIQMPIMDGFEVIKRINNKRAQGEAQALKAVFAITAGGGEELLPEGETLQSMGFERWFVKPISKEQVITLLSEAEEMKTEAVESTVDSEPQQQQEILGFEQELAAIPEQFKNLLNAFAEEFTVDVAEARELANQKNWLELKAKAHYIKGNCMLFQLDRWVEWLRTIEQSLKNEPFDEVKVLECLDNLENAVKYLEKTCLISNNKHKIEI